MGYDKGKISGTQLMLMSASFLQAALTVIPLAVFAGGRDVWLLLIISLAVFLPFVFVYLKLGEMFPQSNLIEINDRVFGGALGKFLSALYLMYFMLDYLYNLVMPASYMRTNFMILTPETAFALSFMLLVLWAARNGIETIARLSVFSFSINYLSVILIFLLLLGKFKPNHFLPVSDIPFSKVVSAVIIVIGKFLSEIFIFLMLLPSVTERSGIKKALLAGISLGCLFNVVLGLLCVGVLGSFMLFQSAPFNATVRQLELMSINSRIEIVVVLLLFFSTFLKNSVIFYALLVGAGSLFRLRSQKTLLIPLTLLPLSLVELTVSSNSMQFQAGRNSLVFLGLIFHMLLPLTTLIVAAIRRTVKRQGGEDA